MSRKETNIIKIYILNGNTIARRIREITLNNNLENNFEVFLLLSMKVYLHTTNTVRLTIIIRGVFDHFDTTTFLWLHTTTCVVIAMRNVLTN